MNSGSPSDRYNAADEPPAKKGCGWGGCLLGCLGVALVSVLLCVGGVWYLYVQAPELARVGLNNLVAESPMAPEDKAEINAQVDRVIDDYKAGKITGPQLGEIVAHLAQSPLFPLLMVYAAEEKHVKPSGLSDEEKMQAKRTLQRVARGVFEKKIKDKQIDELIAHVTVPQPGGKRQLKEHLTDDEVRQLIAACRKTADDAKIPDEPFEVRIGAEFKKAIDEALAPKGPPEDEAPPAEAPPAVDTPDADAKP